jgi:hypothetical protein
MTEENIQVSTAEDVFGALSVPKILIAALQTLGTIVVPTEAFLNAATEDQELKVDYNSDDQTFTFTLKEQDGSGNNNNELITDFE